MGVRTKRGRPLGSKKFDRQISVKLPRNLLDLIEERAARENTRKSETVRRCLGEYQELKVALLSKKILVEISGEDRAAITRLVSLEIVPSFEYATSEALRRYPKLVLSEREERKKAIGSL